MVLYTKIMKGWKPLTSSAKSSILDILLGPENASGFTVFNYFHQKLHLRSLRGQICLCMYLVPQIWRWINTGNVLLGNLSNFQNRFHKKHQWMPAFAISCRWKMFRPKYILKKISHSTWSEDRVFLLQLEKQKLKQHIQNFMFLL